MGPQYGQGIGASLGAKALRDDNAIESVKKPLTFKDLSALANRLNAEAWLLADRVERVLDGVTGEVNGKDEGDTTLRGVEGVIPLLEMSLTGALAATERLDTFLKKLEDLIE